MAAEAFSTAWSMTHTDDLISGMLRSFWDTYTYKNNLTKQVAASKELMDYQNAYNSPSAQMQRLSEAGLNPNLVYGSSAPAGVSGNASASAPSMGSYNTNDIANLILQVEQMKLQKRQVASQIDLQKSQAEKNYADARLTGMEADRYNEVTDTQINEANFRMQEATTRMDLNRSSIQYQTAQTQLAIAEEAYRRGEIGLQQFRKQQIIAQTALYMAQKDLTDTQNFYAQVEGRISELERDYLEAFYDGDRMKELAKADYEASVNSLKLKAEKAAAVIGIEGNKVTQWIDWIMSELGRVLGGAGTAAIVANTPHRVSVTSRHLKP